jgi:NAD-dependent DNA ligase
MSDDLESLVMAHRYLYYVKSSPVISDYEFDKLESKARKELPESSPVHGFGGDTEDGYTAEHKALAKKLIEREKP